MPIMFSPINQTLSVSNVMERTPRKQNLKDQESNNKSPEAGYIESTLNEDSSQNPETHSPIIMKNPGFGSSLSGRDSTSFLNLSKISKSNNVNFNNRPRNSFNLPSTSKSSLFNIKNNQSKTLDFSKTTRSGSIASLLPLRESFPNNQLRRESKIKNIQPVDQKRKKSNSLSIIDYCSILNMTNNIQLLNHFYEETEELMAKLSTKTTKNGNLHRQASLSEQTASLFGSNMCNCLICEKKNKTFPILNYEIVPNRYNTKFTMKKYTYSTPMSQISCLKLFNLMNTDCSINFNPDYHTNSKTG